MSFALKVKNHVIGHLVLIIDTCRRPSFAEFQYAADPRTPFMNTLNYLDSQDNDLNQISHPQELVVVICLLTF